MVWRASVHACRAAPCLSFWVDDHLAVSRDIGEHIPVARTAVIFPAAPYVHQVELALRSSPLLDVKGQFHLEVRGLWKLIHRQNVINKKYYSFSFWLERLASFLAQTWVTNDLNPRTCGTTEHIHINLHVLRSFCLVSVEKGLEEEFGKKKFFFVQDKLIKDQNVAQ